MKKNLFNLFMVALIASAFFACKPEEVIEPPVISFELATAEISETATSALQVKVLADKTFDLDYTVDFTLAGTAVEGTNFETIDPKSVTMTAGETEAVIFINPINVSMIEEDKTIVLSLAASETYTVAAENNEITITLLDNANPPVDAPEVSFTTEGFTSNPYMEEELEITMGISKAVDMELLVGITFSDVLTAGTDFVVEGLNENNQLVLAANETSASFKLTLKNTQAAGASKTLVVGFATPEVTDYAIKATNNTVDVNVVDPVVDMGAWFNDANKFEYLMAGGTSLAYRPFDEMPAYDVKRYYWDSVTEAWGLLSSDHHFYYAANDQNQWTDVINIYKKEIGWPSVYVTEQERYELTAGDYLGLTKFFANEATYGKTLITSGENGWFRFVTTDGSATEGKVIVPAQTLKLYKKSDAFDWTEKFVVDDNGTERSYYAWYADANANLGDLSKSTNVVPVDVVIERSEGTFNSVTAEIIIDIVFTCSDADFSIDPKYYIANEGDKYTMRIKYIPAK